MRKYQIILTEFDVSSIPDIRYGKYLDWVHKRFTGPSVLADALDLSKVPKVRTIVSKR